MAKAFCKAMRASIVRLSEKLKELWFLRNQFSKHYSGAVFIVIMVFSRQTSAFWLTWLFLWKAEHFNWGTGHGQAFHGPEYQLRGATQHGLHPERPKLAIPQLMGSAFSFNNYQLFCKLGTTNTKKVRTQMQTYFLSIVQLPRSPLSLPLPWWLIFYIVLIKQCCIVEHNREWVWGLSQTHQ